MEYWCPFISKRCKEIPQKQWKKVPLYLQQYITQEKGFETGDTTDERWFPSTSRNSPRKGTSKIYNTSPKLGSCNDLTHGKAVFNNKEYGYHLLAKPNGSKVYATSLKYTLIKSSSQVGGCIDLIHGKAVFNNKEYGCHLLAQPNGSNAHATSLTLSFNKSKNTGSCNDLTLGKAVSNNKENGFHFLASPKGQMFMLPAILIP